MSWAPLSVYSSPLLIYSSPLVIYSCRLQYAFIKGLFKCSIHMTDYFLSLFKHFSKIILEELSVLFLNMFFEQYFSFKRLITCYTHILFFFMGVLCHSILYNVLWHLVATFNLSSCFPVLAFSLFSLFPHTSSLSILNSQQQFVYCIFQPPFLGAFTRDGSTCFIYAIVYFLSIAEHFVTKNSPHLSVLFLYKFVYTHFSTPMFGYMSHTGLFFHGGSGSCDFLNFI